MSHRLLPICMIHESWKFQLLPFKDETTMILIFRLLLSETNIHHNSTIIQIDFNCLHILLIRIHINRFHYLYGRYNFWYQKASTIFTVNFSQSTWQWKMSIDSEKCHWQWKMSIDSEKCYLFKFYCQWYWQQLTVKNVICTIFTVNASFHCQLTFFTVNYIFTVNWDSLIKI